MKIYYIDDDLAIKEGITNMDYKITGLRKFRIWVDLEESKRGNPGILLILKKDSIERMGKYGERRYIKITKGEIKRTENGVLLDATHNEKEGAIVFWDLPKVRDAELGVPREYSSPFGMRRPTEVEVKKAEIFSDLKFELTLFGIIYPGGMIEVIYSCSVGKKIKKFRLKLKDKTLKMNILTSK